MRLRGICFLFKKLTTPKFPPFPLYRRCVQRLRRYKGNVETRHATSLQGRNAIHVETLRATSLHEKNQMKKIIRLPFPLISESNPTDCQIATYLWGTKQTILKEKHKFV